MIRKGVQFANAVKSKGERFAAESLFMALILRLHIQKVFEYEANLRDGTAEGKVWEWKDKDVNYELC
jgi:hypothetical protein